MTALYLAMAHAPGLPLVLNWRELMTIGVSISIIYLSYALKESVNTGRHVHITRQGSDEDAAAPADPPSPGA